MPVAVNKIAVSSISSLCRSVRITKFTKNDNITPNALTVKEATPS